jgi:predicted metal-dependent phosphoesterase TrpH
LAPAEVVRRAHAVGLAALALTDHDSVAGIAEACRMAQTLGIGVVAGCELSVRVAFGEMHLLVYDPPVDQPEFQALLAQCRTLRQSRGQTIVAKLNRHGVAIDLEQVERAAQGAPIGRPHVARALIAMGVVKTIDEAFDRFLARGRVAYVDKQLPPLADVAALLDRLGGVSSAAHLRDRGTREILRQLKEQGLDGVEVHHPSHSAEARVRIEASAVALGLLRSGGSDWHGAVEKGLTHGTVGSERVPMEWVDALLARSRERKERSR